MAHQNTKRSWASVTVVIAGVMMALVVACIAAMHHPSAAFASVGDTFESGGVWYTVQSDDTVSVGRQSRSGSNYAADSGAVVIPETVSDGSTTYTVTAINNYAFSRSADYGSEITSVVIPETVTEIGNYAFGGCKQLTSVTFAGTPSLESIGTYAFANCSALQSIFIPISVTELGAFSFYGCYSLSSVEFEDAKTATEPILKIGESAFRSSVDFDNSLVTIELPARITYISANSFYGQNALEYITIYAEELQYIGTQAFRDCESLVEFTFPAFSEGNSSPVASRAFYGCESLRKITFLGDAPSGIGSSLFMVSHVTYGSVKEASYTEYADIETVVYFGSHSTLLFEDSANHYNAVFFYASEEARNSGADPISYACIRDDVAISDINSNLAAVDADGIVIIEEGSIPELSDSGSWYFPDYNQTDLLSQPTNCYLVDPYNLNYANFIGLSSSYAYTGNPIALSFVLNSSDGTQLTEGVDYEISVNYATGGSLSIDQIQNVGTYVITARALGSYTGEVSFTFEVSLQSCTWRALYGDNRYGTMAVIVAEAFSSSDTDTVIVTTGENFPDALAASALAGVRNAPIVTTSNNSLSLDARGRLRALNPTSVLVIGSSDTISDAVVSEIQDALPSTTRITRLYGENRRATALALYTRTLSSGYWDDSTTAILTTGEKFADALSISPYAYVTKSPIFLTDSSGLLDDATVAALQNSSFERIIILGDENSVSEAVKDQLGDGFSYERWSGADRYATSAVIAEHAIAEGVLGVDKVVIATGENFPDALAASALCGRNESVLLLVSSNNTTTIDEVLVTYQYEVTMGYFLGDENSISSSVRDKVTALFEDVTLESVIPTDLISSELGPGVANF